MGKNRITIHDVAAKAGVAISSISRLISGNRGVSEKMLAKVEVSVAPLGYQPDHLPQLLLNGAVASLVSEGSPYIRNTIDELGALVVLLNYEVTGLSAGAVICDHAQGVKEATADLIENGYKRNSFVSERKDVFITRNRIKGYEQVSVESKIEIGEELIRLGKLGEKFAYEQTKDLFSGKNRPTALNSGEIGASTRALCALKELKTKPGPDIVFVALDEWPMFDLLSSDLSSVYRDPEEMGCQFAHLMLDFIAEKAQSQAVISTIYRPQSSS